VKYSVELTRGQVKFLEQERRRFRETHGINVSVNDLIRAMVELHKTRFVVMATSDPDAVPWFYRYLAENNDES